MLNEIELWITASVMQRLTETPPTRAALNRGASMDVAIARRRWPRPSWVIASLIALAMVATVTAWYLPTMSATTQALDAERATISVVTDGVFDDYIPLRGIATPLTSVYLDTIEGGRVEKKLVEDGAMVVAGQPLVVLTNSSLQLEVIRSESEVANQISLERNRADNERAINEIDWQLRRTSQKAARDRQLTETGFVAPAALQDSIDERTYWQSRYEITRRSQQTDQQLQTAQVAQLRISTRQLEANLALARANLDALTVKAPVSGRLTAFEINVGQSLNRGQRLGQIDSPDATKLLVNIDEYYLSRVAVGLTASLDWNGKNYPMAIRKLNPQVRSGQFEGELVFTAGQPEALRRGQTLQAKLALGESKRSLLLPAGAFLAEGGGSFVFVVDGDVAVKRPVQLGRRNVNVIEVVSGLAVGERVLTSSYAGLIDKERLTLSR
jgi:HlyD family secretion protein